ncbi:calcium-binding protein [Microvirga guangxiensis]|uniref:Ca2+-binding protein, RTX toxin-related n=1 Tax=Microvirga guangxiensis TaxID=549386 RepID=A0A1G5DNT0_9HYPH|nr:calcium-binding protein [Microvirga guangxiensis]SCY16028.1 Ca2+-binding protein, RTX toxin-related [Microvirga guangxiensis]
MSANLWGQKFQINTTAGGAQYFPKIAALPNGSFVAVWTDTSQTGADQSETAVRGQILNADGTKKGGEFLINEITIRNQSNPSIAVLNDGRFVVVWTDSSGHDGEMGNGVWGRVYKMDGSEAGNSFHINTPRIGSQMDATVSATANGGFVVTYTDDPGQSSPAAGDGSGQGILAQAYDANVQKFGPETYVNGTKTRDQASNTVIGLKDGRYVVFYTDQSMSADDPSMSTIRGRIMTADGQPAPGTSEFVVPSSRGTKMDPSAVALADGRFVVVWRHLEPGTGDGSGSSIKAQIYNANGTMHGGEFVVNTTTHNDQSNPVVTATKDGGFAVGFADIPDPAKFERVFRVVTFKADGTRSGSDTVAAIDNGNTASSIVALADGRIVLTWDGKIGSANDTQEIWGQILDPRSQAIVLNGSEADDQYVGTTGHDVLRGAGGNDRLSGQGGDDVLDGGIGNDVMDGGAGNDTYYVDSAGDVIVDSSGVDTVVTSYSRGLESFIENLTASGSGALALTGNGLDNVITGNDAANEINGGAGADTMQGGGGDDIYHVDSTGDRIVEAFNGGIDQVYTTVSHALSAEVEHLTALGAASLNLTGNALANVIEGNAGANKIYGGLGNDQLRGGGGKDIFVFDTKPDARTNKDNILDWNHRDDTIQLENQIFKALKKTGKLKKDFFVLGAKAKDGNDYVGYNKKTGDLWYDANGSKGGGQVVFANIGKNKKIAHDDFFVI